MPNDSPPEHQLTGDELTTCDKCYKFIALKDICIKGCSVICKECNNKDVSDLFVKFKKERIEYGTDSKR